MLATTIHKSNTTPHHQDEATTPTRCCLRTQQCAGSLAPTHQKTRHMRNVVARTAPSPHPLQTTDSSRPTPLQQGRVNVVLLRKEVIQPHLPVRLPCYDFVPIADPTFDSSPHKG